MKQKKKTWAYALWFVAGYFGAHRFYLRRPRTGSAFLLLLVAAFSLPTSLGALMALILTAWALADLLLMPGMARQCNGETRQAAQQSNQADAPKARPLTRAELQASLDEHSRAIAEHTRAKRPRPEAHGWKGEKIASILAARPSEFMRGEQYEIEYVDSDGVVTIRKIDVLGVREEPHTTYIHAWCHERSDQRTFREERILSARFLGAATRRHG